MVWDKAASGEIHDDFALFRVFDFDDAGAHERLFVRRFSAVLAGWPRLVNATHLCHAVNCYQSNST